jgi:hypothetical protein
VVSHDRPLPQGIEAHLSNFTELAAATIAAKWWVVFTNRFSGGRQRRGGNTRNGFESELARLRVVRTRRGAAGPDARTATGRRRLRPCPPPVERCDRPAAGVHRPLHRTDDVAAAVRFGTADDLPLAGVCQKNGVTEVR